jgi:hypothetical protein
MNLPPIPPLAQYFPLVLLLLAGGRSARAQNLTFHTNQAPLMVGLEPTCVIAADVNGDGLIDLVTANNGGNTLTILTNTGKGIFVLGTNVIVGATGASGPACVAAADLNGDGRLDLVCVNEFDGNFVNPGTLSVLINAGGLRFIQKAVLTVGDLPYWVAVADFNGDGKPDLVCANSGDTTLTVLTNAGNAVFVPSSTNTVGGSPFFVLAVDVNGDGLIDLVSANNYPDSVTVLTNNGSGSFVLASTFAAGPTPASIAAIDMNGDGLPDLIVADAGENLLTLLTNQGAGHFGIFTTLGVGNAPQSVVAADVNGDGLADLISANFSDDTLSVVTNGGFGRFRFCLTPGVGYEPYCVAAADVNGDGKIDLICANFGDSTVTVLTNAGQLALSHPAFSASTGFQATLSGIVGQIYDVETSTDLIHWATWQYVPITNGSLLFTCAAGAPSLFFRAVQVNAPVLVNPAYSPQTGFQASLLGMTGNTHVIQVSPDLVNWTPLLTNVNTNSLWPFTDSATNLSLRYYRAVTP